MGIFGFIYFNDFIGFCNFLGGSYGKINKNILDVFSIISYVI